MITPHVLDAWPDVSRRVVSRLHAAGASRADAEDMAAEAIERALAKGVTFETPDHLYAWTLHVARNIHVDQRRASGRGPVLHALDDLDVAVTADTATVVEHRLRLERALQVLATFSPADRAAVMEEDAEPAARRDAVRLAVRRHRARSRLRAAIAGIAALIGWRGALGAARTRRVAVALAPVAVVGALVLSGGLPFSENLPFGDALPPAAGTLVVGHVPDSAPGPVPALTPSPTGAPGEVRSAVPADDEPSTPAPTRTNVVTAKPHPSVGVTVYTGEDNPGHFVCLYDVAGQDEICVKKLRSHV